MTTAAIQDRVDELFADARNVHAQAIERLQNGDIRDAAEKAWCATKRATDALILDRTGEEPTTTAATTDHPRQPLPSRPGNSNAPRSLLQPNPQPARYVLLFRLLQRPDRAPHQRNRRVYRRRPDPRHRMSSRYPTVSLAAAGALPHRGAPAIFNQGGQVIQGPVANDRTKP